MGTYSDIIFDDSDWSLDPSAEGYRRWISQVQPIWMSMSCLGIDQSLRPILGDIDAIRDVIREQFAQNGGFGLVQCDEIEICGQPCVKSIAKLHRRGQGDLYMGSLAIPLATESFAIATSAKEIGMTGGRATAAMLILERERGRYEIDEKTSRMIGWAQDPYNGSTDNESLYNQSDDARFDQGFPDHPLSITRATLDKLIPTIRFSTELLKRVDAASKPKKKWTFW